MADSPVIDSQIVAGGTGSVAGRTPGTAREVVRVPVATAPHWRRGATLVLLAAVAGQLAAAATAASPPVEVSVVLAFCLIAMSVSGNRHLRARFALPGDEIVFYADGSITLPEPGGGPSAATVRFAWVGLRQARFACEAGAGRRVEFFVERDRLSAEQWRKLCVWFVWLGRQTAPSAARQVNQSPG